MRHGTYVTYVQGKCRCDDCKEANRVYERRRTRERAYLKHNPGLARLVDAEPVRAHMRSLMSQGMGWKRIARAADVPNGTAYVILYGKGGSDPAEHRPPRKRVRRDVAERLLAVRLDLADGARVDATGTVRRLRALVTIGHPQRTLAAMFGVSSSNSTCLFDGSRPFVTAGTAAAVKAIYDELWDKPGTSARARNDARRKGWHPPLAWDDDTIDDPAAEPQSEQRSEGRTREELLEDFLDTWDYHLGDVVLAAGRLGVGASGLEAALRRLRRDGVDVTFHTRSRRRAS